ncbi:response regulator [Cohnella sp. WQ 127256]|uniref:response regulator n=1 Tax=Cohnella sp. WQ 127256 TaxID=2938790 RepID=UPI002119B005|nr:response regulator [Cohnella sp. WQ 127256]
MLQLLIVDDERVAIEAIRHAIPWEELEISGVFEASNIKKAKEIFEEQSIDILLCDIEMPQGSGLELLEWVRENAPMTVTIFLTCHADFQFAKKAMELGSLDYILKPLPYDELTAAIQKAIQKIKKDSESLENNQFRQAWNRHHPQLFENFWLEVIEQSIPPNPQAILEAASSRKISLPDRMKYVPILLKIHRWNKEFNKREIKILEYALRNAGQELLFNKNGGSGHLIAIDENTLLTIQAYEELPNADSLLANCRLFIEASNQYFYCDLCCYIGKPSAVHEMAGAVEELLEYDQNNVTEINKALIVSEKYRASAVIDLPDMTMWGILLQENARDRALIEIKEYLVRLSHGKGVDKQVLQRFQQNFIQMLYYVLQVKGVQAHELYSDQKSFLLVSQVNHNIQDLVVWVENAVNKAMNYISSKELKDSVVQRVINYISANLDEDLSRDSIADYIGMNPDYLTRVFKKETGLSVVEYISQQRVERAKELLSKTEMQISMVAASVGYHNFSHFSQMFKKHAFMNPGAYRNHSRSLNSYSISGQRRD